ncbi:MAG: hypothetical protein WC732_03795 [Candidatus Omnitrophota bacterium]
MDLLILFMALVFLGMIGAGIFFFLKETPPRPGPAFKIPPAVPPSQDPLELPPKKTARYDEKIKQLEEELQAAQEEIRKGQEREAGLLKEKNNVAFDSSGYERLKKEQAALREEMTAKEETLEEVISARRRENAELIQLRQEFDILRKKNAETEDAFRKAQTIIENMDKDNKSCKALLEQQKKILEEHNVNKTEGQWVSREEFEKLQALLKEKDSLLQKFKTP